MSKLFACLVPRLIIFTFFAVLAWAGPAKPDTVLWTLNGTFMDGGTVKGSFVNDPLSGSLTSWDIIITDAALGGSGLGTTSGSYFESPDYGWILFLSSATPPGSPDPVYGLHLYVGSPLYAEDWNGVLPLGMGPGYGEDGAYAVYGDFEWGPFGWEPVSGSLTVTDSGSLIGVPLPPSAFFFGSVLLGLGGWRMFRKR
jgi:hypothetical protein